MARKFTGTECFAHFGVRPRNVQWSWSARSDDGTIVVVRLWQDRFSDGGRQYRIANYPGSDERLRLGQRELMDNLQHALDHCDGQVRVIVITAKDRDAIPRSIKEGWPADMVMQITAFDRDLQTADLQRVAA